MTDRKLSDWASDDGVAALYDGLGAATSEAELGAAADPRERWPCTVPPAHPYRQRTGRF